MEQFQIEITRCQQIISERRTQIRQIINIQTQTEINSTQNTTQQKIIVDRDERSERQKLIDEIAELENQLVYLKNKLSFSQNANEMNFTQEHVLSKVHVDVGDKRCCQYLCHQHLRTVTNIFVVSKSLKAFSEIHNRYGSIHY